MSDLISEVKAALHIANNPDKYTMPSFLTNVSILEENAMKVLPLLYERIETAERQREEAVKALEAIARDTVDDITEDFARATLKRIKGENGQ